MNLAVFAPVGAKYKLEYYFPDLGLIGYEPSFTLVAKDGEEFYSDHVVPIYPGISDDYGEQLVEEHYQDFYAEILWMITDIWPLTRIPDLARQDRIRWVVSPAVDFLDPIPPDVINKLKPALKVVPWVNEAKERLEKAGLSNVYHEAIPFGLNCDLWKPQDRTRFPNTLTQLGFASDTFNISIVAANQFLRKAWDQLLRGIKLFMEKNPEIPVRIYLHTQLNIGDGWDISSLVASCGLAEVTRTAKPYYVITGRYSEYQLMLIHALADVCITCSLEGFGLSTIQSQAVGTPTIGLNAGATPELVKGGILVPPYCDHLMPNLLRKTEPHPTHIAEALRVIYETPRREFQKGVDFVHENFAWPIIIEKWRRLFREIDEELERRCIKSGRYPPHPSERALQLSRQELELL